MTPVRALLALGLLAGTASLSPGQIPDSDTLLEAVVKANLDIKYRGIRTVTLKFERDGKVSYRRFKEHILRDDQKVRVDFVDGERSGQISVDDGRHRYHYFPKENVIHKSPSLQNQDSQRLEMLMRERRKEYTVTVADGGRVANEYSTYLITLKSASGWTHKLWVDKRRKAILKRELSGPDPNRGSSWEFESFHYKRWVDRDEFEINKPGATVLDPKDRLALAAKKVEYTPYAVAGDAKFELYDSGSFEAEGVKVLRSTYGDGKRVVTLFQFKGSLDANRLKGRFTAHDWNEDGYKFVLVGDLERSELERLARLVRR